jgi:NTE family protein
MERLNHVLSKKPDANGKLQVIDHLIVSPSKDIADLALKHYKTLPKGFRIALTFLGLNRGNSRRFISYLMFIEAFCQELIELGYRDAMKQRRELQKFLET